MTQAFDFDQHRARAVERYGAVRERYHRYAVALESILRVALKGITTHNISARAKDIESFASKASKPHPDDPLRPKYSDPLVEIEDLAGARAIAYVLRDLPRIEEAVRREFDVVERSDKGEQLLEKALVGYRSIHFIVQMKSERVKLPEYQEFSSLRAEVQIRTILQHAWAEIEHDMRYKPRDEPNKELSQCFTALAGLIEVGDREFDQIYEIDSRRERALRDLAQIKDEVPEPTENARSPKVPAENPFPEIKVAQSPPSEAVLESAAVPAKDLMVQERYSDAIVAYSALIAKHPRQFTHYLGRAKARFLAGDVAGAIADIAKAEQLNPKHPFIARVREIIEGNAIADARPAGDQNLAVRQGHTALRDGNAVEALRKYEEAESLGFSPVFSVFNRAMARFVEKKFDLARRTLDRIDPYPGSILEFNVIVLRTLCYLMAGGERTAEAIELVRNLLTKMMSTVGYKYNARSPLADLEVGARKTFDVDELNKASPLFDLLRLAS